MSILMHIGHDKTGTSAIQSVLAMNHQLLSEYNLEYPSDPSFKDAVKGFVSSGNRGAFVDILEFENDKNYLFSSEAILKDIIAQNELWEKIVENKEKFLKVIVYSRNLFDHFFSHWGQAIKRGGSTRSADAFAQSYDVYHKLLRAIESLQQEGISVELHNYSAHQSDIVRHFMQVILPRHADDFLARAELIDAPVNRSLTLAEYELQRCFNRHYGRQSSRFVSDAVINHLPSIRSEKPDLKKKTVELVIRNSREAADVLNKMLPPNEQLDLDLSSPIQSGTSDTYCFTDAQLDVIAASICSKLKQLEEKNDQLRRRVQTLLEEKAQQ